LGSCPGARGRKEGSMKIYFGIDVGGHSHTVHFMDGSKRQLMPELVISDDVDGYDELVARLRELRQRYPGAEIHGGAEATGIYWRNLFFYLKRALPWVKMTLVNPLQTRRYRDLQLRRTKTDRQDSQLVAMYLATFEPAETELPDEHLADLCELVRYRRVKLKEYSRYRNYLHKYLKQAFPELCGKVRRMSGLRILAVLSRYPTAGHVRRASVAEIARLRYGKRCWRVGRATAVQLKKLAERSAASYVGPGVGFTIQSLAANLLRLREETIAFEEKIDELYCKNPATKLITIPGIAGLSAAVIESEVKNISRFKTAEDLVGYAGAYPEIRQSGVSSNPKPRMTHKGNRYLNQTIYMCVLNAISPRAPESAIKHYYYRLIASGKDRMVAIGSCMRKLLHIIHAILTTGKPYRVDYEFPVGTFQVRFVDRKTARYLTEDEISTSTTVIPIKYKGKVTAPKVLKDSR